MDWIEERVGEVDDFADGTMREVKVKRFKVLLVRVGGQISALGATCPHQGASMVEGVLHGCRLVCPWHAAAFDVRSGVLLDPPALEGLPTYPVRIEDGGIYVRVPRRPIRPEPPAPWDPEDRPDHRTFAVLGTGAAGDSAVNALRDAGFRGTILWIGQEERPAYDRTACSKAYLAGQASETFLKLRDEGHDEALGITRIHARVTQLDTDDRRIRLDDGTERTAEKILIATGGTPKSLPIDGIDLPGVHLLRTILDARRLREATTEAKRIILIGAGFIGLEAASVWASDEPDHQITVVDPNTVPLQSIVGERVGRAVQGLHERNGVQFRLGRKVERVVGRDRVERVLLDDGDALESDLVLIGVGIQPATDMIVGLDLEDDGAIRVDHKMRVDGRDDLFAAGDLATYPDPFQDDRPTRVEHWRVAQQMGRVAGRVMAGWATQFAEPTFFWTNQYDMALKGVGRFSGDDTLRFEGDVEALDFLATFERDGRVRGILGTRTESILHFHETLRDQVKVSVVDDLVGEDLNNDSEIPTPNTP